ncbi:class I SAM-dependent methyltransferase [Corynebacterium pygosceleis]|uniref:class I SAM-dependent methyltransferase n=1 Tax=Corynebacterium pygosceleis TaxID=2800406 RepID=UPI00200404B2|nr:class I SAM-dependent methyltransferase [Corynebacterium pygosceleis]MCK7676064.1 class I SAM-dependent methyltransferase [Corynebacterium pygosceleis]
MADHAHNLAADFSVSRGRPIGVSTRGTTNRNRLRRCDRWMSHEPRVLQVLRRADRPLALDVGYGASDTTTVEWAQRLRTLRPDISVTGLEITPERILPPRDGVTFELGGFELAGYSPHLVRAFNVLRQYDVEQVLPAWRTVTSRLAPGGVFVEGTCDELGRRGSWLLIDDGGPVSLTLAWDPFDVERPSDVAARLPKVLIHRNVPGEPVHDLLTAADRAWECAAGWAPHGPRARWREARRILTESGVPLTAIRRPVRDCLLTVPWSVVAPADHTVDW